MAVFVTLKYPPCEDAAEVEFVDVNPSLGNVLGFKLCDATINASREVWKECCPTLVGPSQIVVRFPKQMYVRRMEAVEYFGLIGWSPALWRDDTPYSEQEAMPPCHTVSNLAGNAFTNRMLSFLTDSLRVFLEAEKGRVKQGFRFDLCFRISETGRQRFLCLRHRAVDSVGVCDVGQQLVGDG